MVLKPHRASKRDVTPHGRQSKITSMCWVPLADLPGCTEPQCDHRALSGHKPRKAQDCSANGARAAGKRSPGSSAIADDHTCHLTGVCWNLWKAFPAKPPAAEKNGGCLESWHLLQHCRHICLVECDLKNDMSNRDLNKLICSRSSLYLCLRIDEKRTNNINNGSLCTEWPCLFQK